MIPDLDIYRSAQVLVKRHGEDAPIHAAHDSTVGKDRSVRRGVEDQGFVTMVRTGYLRQIRR